MERFIRHGHQESLLADDDADLMSALEDSYSVHSAQQMAEDIHEIGQRGLYGTAADIGDAADEDDDAFTGGDFADLEKIGLQYGDDAAKAFKQCQNACTFLAGPNTAQLLPEIVEEFFIAVPNVLKLAAFCSLWELLPPAAQAKIQSDGLS